MKLIRYVFTFFYSLYLKNKNIYISPSVILNKNTKFQGKNKIGKDCIISNTSIGFATYIGANTYLSECEIGKYCSIAQNVKVLPFTHQLKRNVSTHPCFFSLLKQSGFTYVNEQRFKETIYLNEKEKIVVEIGNDVWIGENVIIMGGVKINNGAVIGAGAIVTKDVPAYAIVVGVPAKIIKYRFEVHEIEFLNKLNWWDKDENWILDNLENFDDISKIMKI